ncbi:MAG: glutathione S-transferase family protein [Pseudomonadota bacterium]
MIKLLHVNHSRSMRVLWMLEEVGADYEVLPLTFQDLYGKVDALTSRHPIGSVPIIEDGDLTLFESAVILDYLADTYGKGAFKPAFGAPDYYSYMQWLHYAEGLGTKPFTDFAQHTMLRDEDKRIAQVAQECQERGAVILQGYEKVLREDGYIVGDSFTAADVANGYTINIAKAFGMLTDALPKTHAYWERVTSRPAFKRAYGQA